MPEPWNINIHYDATLSRLAPRGAGSALDVGCGDGFLSARLASRGLEVVAVDADRPVVERARARFPDVPVDWVVVDAMRMGGAPAPADRQEAASIALSSLRIRRIAQNGGIVVVRRF